MYNIVPKQVTDLLHTGTELRIEVNVFVDRQGMASPVVHDSFKSSLKQRSNPLILPIEPNAVAHIEPLDGPIQVGLRGFNLEVIVATSSIVLAEAFGVHLTLTTTSAAKRRKTV